jgi:GR25 family glycosyltransferase involved in LPS biosynthesis
MVKKYVIHMPSSVDRDELVKNIINITGASIFDAICSKNPIEGCARSHIEIYKKEPNEPVIIFEDDCVILDKNILSLVDMYKDNHDIIYFGVNKSFLNDKRKIQSWGTHAMWISQKAKKIVVDDFNKNGFTIAFDLYLNKLCDSNNLRVWRPADITKYCIQKTGLKSTLTGKIRTPF